MPAIYLSPSLQEFSPFLIGGTEEFYMNLIADAMVPYLRSSGIAFSRNDPGKSLTQVIWQSNTGNYDLHLALHSNASPENMRGILQGPDVYFYSTSERGRSAAEIIAGNLKKIYPEQSLVATIPTTIRAELRRTSAPAVLVEIAYQDNYTDAMWVRDHIGDIGRSLSQSVAQFLDVPFIGSKRSP
ncbi:MAG: N-acetylmuramoyl-L-alanine amidase [Eubacteriales bacterium]|nr:N-acetylmuramoyl-L-alanine amidase [Eubacteriales bacterium]